MTFDGMEQKTAIKQLKKLERMGGVKGMRLAAEEWPEEWQTLVSIIMSARTRDETTIKVAEKLFAKFKTPTALATARAADVSSIIRPVNFYRNKTKSIIALARVLVEDFSGAPPHDITKLVELPGVGRKTANVFLSEMGTDAIGVDTHVSYISQKLGWTKHRDPHKIEADLRNLFPQKYWRILNPTLVRFGKTHQSRARKNELLERISKMQHGRSEILTSRIHCL